MSVPSYHTIFLREALAFYSATTINLLMEDEFAILYFAIRARNIKAQQYQRIGNLGTSFNEKLLAGTTFSVKLHKTPRGGRSISS